MSADWSANLAVMHKDPDGKKIADDTLTLRGQSEWVRMDSKGPQGSVTVRVNVPTRKAEGWLRTRKLIVEMDATQAPIQIPVCSGTEWEACYSKMGLKCKKAKSATESLRSDSWNAQVGWQAS